MAISTQSLTGLNVPKNKTYFYFIIYISGMTLGAVLYRLKFSIENHKFKKYNEVNNSLKSTYIFLKINYYIIYPITLYLLFKALYIMLNSGNLEEYRALALGVGEETSIIFGSMKLAFLYQTFIPIFTVTSFLFGLSNYILSGKIQLVFVSIIPMIMDSIIFLGRGSFYFILLFGIISILQRNKITLTLTLKLLLMSMLFFIIMLFFSHLRGDENSYIDIILNTIINYHTYSFSLFDIELNDSTSLLNQITGYGAASLGIIDTVISIVLKQVGFNIQAWESIIGIAHQNFQIVGYQENGNPITANAFYTILYTLYLDGGILAIVLYSVIYGYLISMQSIKNILAMSQESLTYKLFLLYVGIFGLFMPVLGTSILLIPFYLYLITNYQKNRKI